ncbi:squalene/phytoene synthase family protein [Streptomyces mobaraensis]|uniref:Phytoene/squalene synthase family protein n=1 Tax=Streptomyces mobaraensis TaxID=35621 RepID=A0A5N5W9F0_STRMB|nr:squalene/phytoene synthase family protein [Streptomyces mobaraensis]KAB7846858.1 phytoene/squalene synthase family protein [Streptomyces mobaraensis]
MPSLPAAHQMVRAYSTTWYEPVTSMPRGLNEATTSAYLCMRAIDEIEDHPRLDDVTKARLLRCISHILQTDFTRSDVEAAYRGQDDVLPEVTLRLGEWTALAPREIAPRVLETFAVMADRMAEWVESGFAIHTERDLSRYTYAVSGTLVLLLSDLWAWYDGTRTHRTHGIGYGRALQAANILIDRGEDLERGVDFWPDDWQQADMLDYVRTQSGLADAYLDALPPGPARTFCGPALKRYYHAISHGAENITGA